MWQIFEVFTMTRTRIYLIWAIVSTLLLVVALMFILSVRLVFQDRDSFLFKDSTYTFSGSVNLTDSFVLQECTVQLSATDELPYKANVLQNAVDNSCFSCQVTMKIDGKEHVFELVQLWGGPVPKRPDCYFVMLDMSDVGLGLATWQFYFNANTLSFTYYGDTPTGFDLKIQL